MKRKPYSITVPARTNKIIKVPVTIRNGTGILEYIRINKDTEIPGSLVKIKNYHCLTTVSNSSTNDITFNILQPHKIEILETIELNFI